MGVLSKGKRKLIYKDQLFYWFSKEDELRNDFAYAMILSEDKKIKLRCNLYPTQLIVLSKQNKNISVPFDINYFSDNTIYKLITLYFED